MNLLKKIIDYGLLRAIKDSGGYFKRKSGYLDLKYRNIDKYKNPTDNELKIIEENFALLNLKTENLIVCKDDFDQFKKEYWFPENYHGGIDSVVYDEKLLEHFISHEILGIKHFEKEDIYIDFGSAHSPWVNQLAERYGIQSYAIDLEIPSEFDDYDNYIASDACHTGFKEESVKAASAHCSFEMFNNNDDVDFVSELARILEPGGKAVIVPLYTHTHYCSYSTPSHFGKGFSDKDAIEYIRLDIDNIPSSRKYDPHKLKERILDTAVRLGLSYKIHVLQNKKEIGDNIYCHFILEISK